MPADCLHRGFDVQLQQRRAQRLIARQRRVVQRLMFRMNIACWRMVIGGQTSIPLHVQIQHGTKAS